MKAVPPQPLNRRPKSELPSFLADTAGNTSFFLDHLIPHERAFRFLLGLLPTRPFLRRVATVKRV